MTKKQDHTTEALEHLTEMVIEAIENNPGQWTKPWADTVATSGMPTNTEGKGYTGGNVILALSAQIDHEYSTGIWGTYNQWAKALGGTKVGKRWMADNGDDEPTPLTVARKGEKATWLLRPQIVKVTKDAKGNDLPEDKRRTFTTFRGFPVFNASQVEGGEEWALATYGPKANGLEPVAAAEQFIQGTGARVLNGPGGAFYTPSGDYINVPRLEQYQDTIAYYSTVVHELGHWTGHTKRLNRPGITTPAAERTRAAYGFEELIAELTSIYVGAGHLGLVIEPRTENAQYLASWIRTLKEDPKVLWKAASAAAKAAAYLVELQPAALAEVA